jgi:hypothetical protein
VDGWPKDERDGETGGDAAHKGGKRRKGKGKRGKGRGKREEYVIPRSDATRDLLK